MTATAANAVRRLNPAPERGRLTGFGPLLRKELGAWWSTRRWWIHALLWLGLMNGLLFPVYLTVLAHPDANLNLLEQLAKVFFSLGGATVAIGAVIVGQDAIIGERQLGTAAWVLSKPVSRTAFVLTKFLAHAISFSVIAVILQAVIAYFQIGALTGTVLEVVPFVIATGLVIINLLFYIALTLLLGTLFKSRGVVLLIGLGLLFATPLLIDIAPFLANVIPYGLPEAGVGLVMGMPVAEVPVKPILLSVVWGLSFLLMALWRFEREEL